MRRIMALKAEWKREDDAKKAAVQRIHEAHRSQLTNNSLCGTALLGCVLSVMRPHEYGSGSGHIGDVHHQAPGSPTLSQTTQWHTRD